MQFDLDAQRAKTIARALHRRHKTTGAPLSYSQVLDGLAEGLGYRNWSTLSSLMGGPDAAAPLQPRIPAYARDPLTGNSATFDAAGLLERMSEPELFDSIELLEACGYADDDPVLALAEAAAGDPGNDDLADLTGPGVGRDPETLDVRIDVSVDADAVRSWLHDARPAVYQDLVDEGVIEAPAQGYADSDLLDGRTPAQGPDLETAAGNALIVLAHIDESHGPHPMALVIAGPEHETRVLAARGYRYITSDGRYQDTILIERDGAIWAHGDLLAPDHAGTRFARAGTSWAEAEARLDAAAEARDLEPAG